MEPKDVVRVIMDYIGPRGVVAGGSIRDLVLKRIPKDYDIFIFGDKDFIQIIRQKGIFDMVPQKVEPNTGGRKYPSTFEVYNTTLDEHPIQIIWSEYYTENARDRTWFRKHRIKATGDDVVAGFDFTCNMLFVDHEKKVHITDEASVALQRKKVIFNQSHKSAFFNKLCTAEHLVRRMVYLADKLDFEVAKNTLDKIYRKYGPMEVDMENLELTKKESVSAY